MHHCHCHSSTPPYCCILSHKHSTPAVFLTPNATDWQTHCFPQPQAHLFILLHFHINLPKLWRVRPTSLRVASPIVQPKVKITLITTLRVEAPTFIVHWTFSCTTTDPIITLAPPHSHTPVSSCTRSHSVHAVTPARTTRCKNPAALFSLWASLAFTINRMSCPWK